MDVMQCYKKSTLSYLCSVFRDLALRNISPGDPIISGGKDFVRIAAC